MASKSSKGKRPHKLCFDLLDQGHGLLACDACWELAFRLIGRRLTG